MILKLPIKSRNKLAPNKWEISFDLQGRNFKFKPGQYIKIILPEVDLNHPKGNMREFSIITSPSNKTSLTVAFKESDSDFKQALLALSLGGKVNISGPFGDLILPEDLSKPIVMIAGGLGITPFLSMLSFLSENNFSTNIFLIYINSRIETATYLDFLLKLKHANKHFNFANLQGKIIKSQLESYLKLFDKKAIFMIAGPLGMVRDTRLNLVNLGISKEQILIEEFTGY